MKTIVAGLIVLVGCAGASAGEADILEIELRLFGALRQAGQPADAPEGPSLLVDLARTGERWERVWSVGDDDRHMKFLTGCVTKADVSSERIALEMVVRLSPVARIRLDMKRDAEGGLSGTYRVASRAGTLEGPADGRVKPARPPLPDGFVPVRPGERPRVLFRRSEVPALKAKLATPLGRVLFEKMGDEEMGDAIGAGVKYQLTGRQEFADRARGLAEMQMAGRGARWSNRTAAGRRPKQVAVAYDLCYDAWPEDFKRKVVAYLLADAEDTIAGRDMGGNKHVCSNWWAKPYSALAFIGLALWGEPGEAPPGPPADGPDADLERILWRFDMSEWERLGRVNPDYQRLFETGRQLMYWHYREAVGTGGFRGECAHYGLKATEMPAEYAPCYRRMFGRHVSPYDDITHMLPRMVFCHDYPADGEAAGEGKGGRPVPLNINGWSAIWGNYFASLYEVTPERWRPAMLWAWNRQLGVTGPDGAARMLADRTMDEHGTGHPAPFFVGYPADATPRHPAECMPLSWQAPDMGYYGFRSGWTGRGDFVLGLYAKTRHIGGWKGPNAGTFRLYGLGRSWNDDYSGREISTWQANRVCLPEDETHVDGCGRVVHVQAAPDGPGAVTVDLTDSYSGPTRGLYTHYGGIRHASAYKDNGIRALRAFGVDYSGKCGAPCLFVLVDRITGGRKKVWTWNLGDAKAVAATTVRGNTFTVACGEGTLRGTFVAPAKAEIDAAVHKVTASLWKGKKELKIPSIHARGGDAFFLVATVQPAGAAPPEVKVSGTGLDAVVTVGARRVTFDGTRVVFSDAGQ